MKPCRSRLDLFLLVCLLGVRTAAPCGCYGPASTPKQGECQCRRITNASQLYDEFTKNTSFSNVNYNLPEFTVHPQGGTYVAGMEVTLSCNITFNDTLGQPVPVSITWEHNGTRVNTGTTSSALYSRLTISQFSASSQGDYLCKVNNGNYTILSRTAVLELPKFYGWSDEIYVDQSQTDNITITTTKGGSVILECSPNTTESLSHLTPTWPRLSSLKSSSVLPSGNVLLWNVEQEVQQECYWALRPESKMRSFTVLIATKSTTTEVTLVATPKDRIVALGSRVSLYCIAESDPAADIRWFKNGQEVEEAVIRGNGEVLEILNATLDIAGNYTCIASNGFSSKNSTASLSVVEPPSRAFLSVTGGGTYAVGPDTFIPMDTANTSITLQCHVDTSSSETMQFRWLFRGEMISPQNKEDSLQMPVSDPWEVVGSFQCIAWNIAGQVSASTQVLPQSNGKPSPPTKVWIRKNTSEYFRYDIMWTPLNQSPDYTIHNYTIQTLVVYSPLLANFCSCTQEYGDAMFPFQAGCPGFPVGHPLYYRVAVNTNIGQSDFMNGHEIRVVVDAPPLEELKDEVKTPNDTTHMWDVELMWTYQHKDEYKPECYVKDLQLKCAGMDNVVNVQYLHTATTHKTAVACCTKCTWTLSNTNDDDSKHSNVSRSFTTMELRPSQPPNVSSVVRTGSNGTIISVSYHLPENSASCICDPSQTIKAVVQYSNATLVRQTSQTISADGTSLTVNLPEAQCWAPYNVSLAFSNTQGMSNFSEMYSIGGPTEDDVLGFVQQPNESINMTAVFIHYELNSLAKCLLSRGLVLLQMCSSEQAVEVECSTSVDSMTCQNITIDQEPLVLPRYHNYCVVGPVAYLTDSHFTVNSTVVRVHADEGIPKDPPDHLTLKNINGSLTIQWEAPPRDTWNGILSWFNVTVLQNGKSLYSTNVSANSTDGKYTKSLKYEYNTNYNVTVSACTRVGCGPPAVRTTEENEPTQASSDTSIKDLILMTTLPVVASSTLLVVILMVIVCCLLRKRKHVNEAQRDTDKESTCSSEKGDSEPLRRDDLIPLSGAPAPSEITECESLHRTEEWVKACPDGRSRDDYMRDVDVELECGSNSGNSQEGSEKETTTLLPSKARNPVAQLTILSNGYCSDVPIPPQSTANVGTADKGGSSTFTQKMCSSSNASSSSGHSTQQSSTQSPSKTSHIVGGANYTTLGSRWNQPLMEAVRLEDTHSDFDPTFIEEFSGGNSSGWSPGEGHIPPSTAQLSFPLSSQYLPKRDKSSNYPFSSPPELAEGDESDSVFDDTSLGQSSPPPVNQQRTRSAVTSGFCSQSDYLVSNRNVATNSFKDERHQDFTFEEERSSNPFITTSPQWGTFNSTGYVVPTLLTPQKMSDDTKLPSKSDGYINTEGISLEHISHHLH